MRGIATLTIVASIDTISRLRQQDTRMMALRRRLSAADSFIHTTIVKLQLSSCKLDAASSSRSEHVRELRTRDFCTQAFDCGEEWLAV